MAAVKRSRKCRTPSSGDTTMLTSSSNEIFSPVSRPIRLVAPLPPPTTLAVAMAAPSVRKPSPTKNRPPIFTICSSSFEDSVGERSDEGDSKKFGGFLEKCCFCRKVIDEGKAVFMYRYLQAYCTAECREKQIQIDKNLEKLAAKPKQKCTGKRVGFF